MVARVTLAEIDAVRMSVPRAVKVFEDEVLPGLREQEGYEGWADDASAEAGIESGAYRARVEKFVTVMRAPPGRETYAVAIADAPAAALG